MEVKSEYKYIQIVQTFLGDSWGQTIGNNPSSLAIPSVIITVVFDVNYVESRDVLEMCKSYMSCFY